MAGSPPWISSEEKLKEICEQLPQMFANGESVAEICVSFGIARSTFYKNIEENPELKEAYEMGKLYSEAWWQKLGRAGAAGKVKIQPQVYIANMSNRFGWTMRSEVDNKSSDGSMTPKTYAPEQYKQAQDKLKDELDGLD